MGGRRGDESTYLVAHTTHKVALHDDEGRKRKEGAGGYLLSIKIFSLLFCFSFATWHDVVVHVCSSLPQHLHPSSFHLLLPPFQSIIIIHFVFIP